MAEKMNSADRLSHSFRGPWAASDGPIASGRNYGANGRRYSSEPMSSGMSLVRFDGTTAEVDSLYPDLDDLPTQGRGHAGTLYAAGRQSVTRSGGMTL